MGTKRKLTADDWSYMRQIVGRGGLSDGYRVYRFGPEPKKPAHDPIYKGKERREIVSAVKRVLKRWRLSHFQHEASCRNGLRAALCMKGYGWRRADDEAAAIVAEALHAIGAKRPSWVEGQRQYAVPRENYQWCASPLDEAVYARGRRFCDDVCQKSARERDAKWHTHVQGMQHSAALYIAMQDAIPSKPCGWCGKSFRPKTPEAYHETETCSIECRENLLISHIPKRHCDQCGKLYQPAKTHSTYCNEECRTDHKNEKRNAESQARRAPRPCDHCGKMFTPSKSNQMFCGPRCKANALYARKGWTVMEPKSCVECGSMFTPRNRNTQEYCSSKCQIRVWARRRRQKAKAAKQAGAFTCEECPPVRKAA